MKLDFLKRNNDLGLLILRVSVAFLMLMHGMAKIAYGVDPIMQMVVAKGLPHFVAYGVCGRGYSSVTYDCGFQGAFSSRFVCF